MSGSSSQLCCRCFQSGASACSQCKSVYYCGRVCQKKDWELGHKIKCREIRAAAAAKNGTDDAQKKADSQASKEEADDTKHVVPPLPLPSQWLYSPSHLPALCTSAPSYPPLPVGLLNPKKANSCFYNVVLQTLMYTRPFLNLLDQLQHAETACVLGQAGKFCMICAAEKHRAQVMKHSREAGENTAVDASVAAPAASASASSIAAATAAIISASTPSRAPKPVLPVHLLSNLDKLCSDYQLGQQEDSHDTMKNLLHAFDDAWRKNYVVSRAGDAPLRLSQRTLETTPISQLFGGQLLSELQCANCRKFTCLFEFFLDLSLEIIEATDDLGEMLEAFSRPEKLDAQNTYKCSHCSKATRARKQITIYQPPNVMMVQLKRFRMGLFGKVNKYIKFPLELSLRKYMSGCQLEAEDLAKSNGTAADGPGLSTIYRLYAVIVHLDLLNVSSFGHYICYIRDVHRPDEWLRFDDDDITRVSAQEVLKQNAYILFYQRTTPFVSSEEVAEEPSPQPADSAAADANDASSSPPSADAPVQCTVSGCGFWGKASTNSMCSQHFREHQEEAGIIERRPSPKPASRDDARSTASSVESQMMMRAMMARQALAQIESSPELRMRLATDPQLRAQYEELRADATGRSQPLSTPKAPAPSQLTGADAAANALQQLQLQVSNQRRVAELHREQEAASRTHQLPPSATPTSNGTTKPTADSAAPHQAGVKIGRNDKCPCKSGRKYKACHGKDAQ